MFQDDVIEYLKRIYLLELENKIRNFRKLNKMEMSVQEIVEATYNVLWQMLVIAQIKNIELKNLGYLK